MRHQEVTLDDKFLLTDGRVFITGVQALLRVLMDQNRLDRAAGPEHRGLRLRLSRLAAGRAGPAGRPRARSTSRPPRWCSRRASTRTSPPPPSGAASRPTCSRAPATTACSACGTARRPGVDRTGDAFKHANFAGVLPKGGVLAVAGDDHTCKSSTLPSPVGIRLPGLRDAGAVAGRRAGGAGLRPAGLRDVALLRPVGRDDRAGRHHGFRRDHRRLARPPQVRHRRRTSACPPAASASG